MSYKEPLKALENYREKCKQELREIREKLVKHNNIMKIEYKRKIEIEDIIISLEKAINLLKKEA